jgi:deoxyribodipyrimidine photo-lyase
VVELAIKSTSGTFYAKIVQANTEREPRCVERPMSTQRSLCWLRRDLRLSDSAPLATATSGERKAAVVFVWDDTILSKIRDKRNRRVSFMHASLLEIDEGLRKHGSRLVVRRGDPAVEIPKLSLELGATLVVWGDDYDPIAIERDQRISTTLRDLNIETQTPKDNVIFHRNDVMTAAGAPFKVYSPYARTWKAKFRAGNDDFAFTTDPDRFLSASELPASVADWSLTSLGFEQAELWLKPGEEAAKKRLTDFARKICDYAEGRDFPAKEETSTLSVDLRFGAVSIRAAVRLAISQAAKQDDGPSKWLNELIWRDFYRHILFHFPFVVETPFQPDFREVQYPGNEADWARWRDGLTGYPLVDAAMRCLNETGFMHNRLRMVVASFLSKDLLLDYRQGEQWFARQLLDYELASNNGGWQWASSVGCDPQPYFRIFNPILQSKKFDPEGAFIRKWIPELRELTDSDIHFPADASEMALACAGVVLGKTYPKPCVDHNAQRTRAVALLEAAKARWKNSIPG